MRARREQRPAEAHATLCDLLPLQAVPQSLRIASKWTPSRRTGWLTGSVCWAIFAWLVPAQASAQVCSGGAVLRVGPHGFAFLVDQVSSNVPERFDLPRTSTVVMDWPLTTDDARLDLGPIPGAIALHNTEFMLLDGGVIRLRTFADVDVDGPATLSNAIAGLGSERCQVKLQLRQVLIEADFQLQDLGGQVHAQVVRTNAASNESQRIVSIQGCTVGDLYTRVSSELGIQSEVGTKQWVETFAQERIPRLIESGFAQQSLEGKVGTQPLRYTAQLTQAQSDASGLVLRADVSVDPQAQGFAPCLTVRAPPLAPSCDVQAPPPLPSDAMYGASFSAGLVNRALHATWRAGLLCIDSNRLALPELEQDLAKLSSILGLPAGTRLMFQVSPSLPPYVQFSQRDGARLYFDELELNLNIIGTNGQTGDLRVQTSFSVTASPRLHPATNALGLDLGAIDMRTITLGHAGQNKAAIQLDPARLQRFISDVALPLLRRQLERSPLSPSVVEEGAYFAVLRYIFIGDDYLTLQVDALKPSVDSDTLPPDTQLLESPPGIVSPRILSLKATGVDNLTPQSLLRFQLSTDGGPWSTPRFGGLVDVVPHGGQQYVSIAAVDLRGQVDPTPVTLMLDVDDTPPQVHLTRRPDELIKTRTIELRFTAQDDRSPPGTLTFTSELLRIEDNGGATNIVEHHVLPASSSSATLHAPGSGLFRARITASDQAGNISSAEVGVVVEDEGCVLGGLSRRPSKGHVVPILALIGFALLRRAGGIGHRRHRRSSRRYR